VGEMTARIEAALGILIFLLLLALVASLVLR
jgi:hypothetical protein